MLDRVQAALTSDGYPYCRLDGKTSVKERSTLVDKFNSGSGGKYVFCISTRAGGLGLNLVAANKVVIFDPNWNPSHDLQAQDRAFRIGQRRDVDVFRLISVGTVEERMYLRQVYKQKLASAALEGTSECRIFAGVQGDKGNQGELFGMSNIFELPTKSGGVLTSDIMRRYFYPFPSKSGKVKRTIIKEQARSPKAYTFFYTPPGHNVSLSVSPLRMGAFPTSSRAEKSGPVASPPGRIGLASYCPLRMKNKRK
ncbi:P-loop containing nucleoside triphosphate hydrolase protein [Pavlovales sp. CCMP2436]|nr:P-loop containing nucleoside triphosphate hydrolase protein [Pavlovales sp. CCMP2436]